MHSSATLPSLLSRVLDGLEHAYAQEGARHRGMPRLDLWANLLRAVDESGVDRSELPAVLRLSKRAVRTRISIAMRHGLVTERKLGRGETLVRLTTRGTAIAARWKDLERSAEKAWCKQIGADRAGRLQDALKGVVAALPLEHPHYPARYGPADARITGGNGIDWRPVLRRSGDTVSDLSLSALTSQALVAFATEYEESSPVALSVSISVIRRIPAEGMPLRKLGQSVDVSALLRHGFLQVKSESGRDLAYLTAAGLAVSAAHDSRIQTVEMEWSNRFGAKLIAALRSGMEDLVSKNMV